MQQSFFSQIMVPSQTLAVDGLFSICCVSESRGIAKEFGLAHLDFVHGVCSLAQFADAPMIPCLLRHLVVANPQVVAEILPVVANINSWYTASLTNVPSIHWCQMCCRISTSSRSPSIKSLNMILKYRESFDPEKGYRLYHPTQDIRDFGDLFVSPKSQ